jgi:hypothetical protein
MPIPDLIAEVDYFIVEANGLLLFETGEKILFLRRDDDSETVVLVGLADAFGDPAVGDVDDLADLRLFLPADGEQQLLVGRLDEGEGNRLPVGEQHRLPLHQCIVAAVLDAVFA